MKDEEIIEILKGENDYFKKLCDEHIKLNNVLDEINKKHYLSLDEEVEKKRMQKEKLYKKDKIAEFVRNYRNQHQK